MGTVDRGLPHAGTGLHLGHAHREALDRAVRTDPGDLSPDEVDATVTARLVGLDRLAASGRPFRYAHEYAPGLVEVLTLDLPTAVVTLDDEDVARLHAPVAEMVDRGRLNLQRAMAEHPPVRHEVTVGGRSVQVLVGESPYTASFSRYISDALALWHPDADLSGGMVFALPHRHAVVYRMCATPEETLHAVDAVPAQAAAMRDDREGDLPPDTWFWLDRRVVRLSEPGRPLPDGHRHRRAG